MTYHQINMDEYKRKNHFNYFRDLSNPYTGVTVNIEITNLLAAIKEYHLPFFLTFLYCVSNAANSIPAFRQRILEDGIIEFDRCRTSHVVMLDDETFCSCDIDSDMPFEKYLPNAKQAQEAAKKQNAFIPRTSSMHDLIYVSSTPWFTYTDLIQPTPNPADSVPRIVWGAFFHQEGKVLIPVSVLGNHALIDGLHFAQFYDALNKNTLELSGLIQTMPHC